MPICNAQLPRRQGCQSRRQSRTTCSAARCSLALLQAPPHPATCP